MRHRAAVLTCAVLALVAACTDDDDAQPAPTTQPPVSTTVVDRSGIALAAVAGTTTSTITERGTATVTGSVQGPAGPVAGATVRIERLVAGREIRADVLTGPDGRFVLGGVPGGRYRVRAFLAPSYAQVTPEIRFLADGAEHTFDLVVEQQSGLVVRADVAPDTPLLGQPVNLVALIASRAVGADGIVRSVPVVGATVELVGLGRWQLRDDTAPGPTSTATSTTTTTFRPLGTTTTTTRRALSPTARTDGAGQVRFELRCTAAGNPGLALQVPVTITPAPDPTGAPAAPQPSTDTVPLDLPACVDPATTTTTAAVSTTAPP